MKNLSRVFAIISVALNFTSLLIVTVVILAQNLVLHIVNVPVRTHDFVFPASPLCSVCLTLILSVLVLIVSFTAKEKYWPEIVLVCVMLVGFMVSFSFLDTLQSADYSRFGSELLVKFTTLSTYAAFGSYLSGISRLLMFLTCGISIGRKSALKKINS